MSVTFDVSQLLSPDALFRVLKDIAFLNILFILVTLEVSQKPISVLNKELSSNSSLILVTRVVAKLSNSQHLQVIEY